MRTFVRVTGLGALSSLPLGLLLSACFAVLDRVTVGGHLALWVIGPLFAASVVVHEMGHAACLWLLQVPVNDVRRGWGGLAISLDESPPLRRMASAAAGPLLAAISGVVVLVLFGPQPVAAVYGVLAIAHGLTLLMPGGDSRAVLDGVAEWRGSAQPADTTQVVG